MTDTPGDAPAHVSDELPSSFADVPRRGLSEEERAAALRAGQPPLSQPFIIKAVLILAAAIVVGLLIEHFLGNTGTPARQSTPIAHAVRTTTTATGGVTINSSLENLLGLRNIEPSIATSFSLTDQQGHSIQLSQLRGRVVVLTFFDENCQDICPVLGSELRQANAQLGAAQSQVTFLIVNTNPLSPTVQRTPVALRATGLSTLANVEFLTGPLKQLNRVWATYGVQIRVNKFSGQITHNNAIYFITAAGKLSAMAVPFGNNSIGRFTLSAGETHRFAEGIAQVVGKLEHL